MYQNTARSAERLSATTWFMPTLMRTSQQSSMMLHAMVTFDPLILGDCGYPRLMTNASICQDAVFEDRVMMHPLIMGLSAQVQRKFGPDLALGIELAAAGEPAFGPPSYFMRPSATQDPVIPLTHHSLNPFHTAYGVVTPSWSWRALRAEASIYNGNGLDNDAYDFDFARMHSYAGRLSYAFSPKLSAQASATSMQGSSSGQGGHGGHGAGGRAHAYSASLQAGHSAGNRSVDATLAWAAHRAAGRTTHSGLLEAQLGLAAHVVFARAESADQIEIQHIHDITTDEITLITHPQRITELTGGYAFKLPAHWGLQASIGVRGSMIHIPTYLEQSRYNTGRGKSFAVFSSLRPVGHAQHQAHVETQH
jgi:hypothetical protein